MSEEIYRRHTTGEAGLQLVRDFAQRVREGRAPGTIGATVIAFTREAWRLDTHREDAQVIINRYPADFPLMGARAAE